MTQPPDYRRRAPWKSGNTGTMGVHADEADGYRVARGEFSGASNRLSRVLRPIACWKLAERGFEFAHKFVKPTAKPAFNNLIELRNRYPGAPLSLFGHADPVGKDASNKQLAEERALAVYGVLRHDPLVWREIFADEPDLLVLVQRRLNRLGHACGKPDGVFGDNTAAGVASYMKALYAGPTLRDADFLSDAMAAVQGCSEFNPLRLLSASMESGSKSQRNKRNAPNRRVVGFLFEPGTFLSSSRWPCPRASEGIGGCKQRFFPDGEARRAPGRARQRMRRPDSSDAIFQPSHEFERDMATFACEFYAQLAEDSPCELVSLRPIKPDEPSDPDPPDEPDPDPDPDDDPPDEPNESGECELHEVYARCMHDTGHGTRTATSNMALEVVPIENPGDLVELDAEVSYPHTNDPTWFVGRLEAGADPHTVIVPSPKATLTGAWLMFERPRVYPVEARTCSGRKRLAIHAYPADVLAYRKEVAPESDKDHQRVRDALEWLLDWVADGIQIELPRGSVDIDARWREYVDHRAFYYYRFHLVADPVFGFTGGTVDIGPRKAIKWLKKVLRAARALKKLTKAAKALDWLIEKLEKLEKSADKITKYVDIGLTVQPDLRLAGDMELVRDKPEPMYPEPDDEAVSGEGAVIVGLTFKLKSDDGEQDGSSEPALKVEIAGTVKVGCRLVAGPYADETGFGTSMKFYRTGVILSGNLTIGNLSQEVTELSLFDGSSDPFATWRIPLVSYESIE